MIINSHVHVNTGGQFYFYSEYDFKKFIKEMDKNDVYIALPCLNPKVGEIRCPNDCSHRCKKCLGGINNNLQSCDGCKERQKHRVAVESHEGKYRLRCKTCEKVIMESYKDPLRKYNIELMKRAEKFHGRVRPLLYISLCEATVQSEIYFYEEHFKGMYYGYKFHPWTDQVSVKDFKITTTLPILIHTGLRELESAENAVQFAENHPNNKVVIAHAAQLKKEVLKTIAKTENIYLDCCPASFLYKNKESCFEDYSKISKPEDIFYAVFKAVGFNRCMFGTDSPWGNTKEELEIIKRLDVSKTVKDNILFGTAIEVYF